MGLEIESQNYVLPLRFYDYLQTPDFKIGSKCILAIPKIVGSSIVAVHKEDVQVKTCG